MGTKLRRPLVQKSSALVLAVSVSKKEKRNSTKYNVAKQYGHIWELTDEVYHKSFEAVIIL